MARMTGMTGKGETTLGASQFHMPT
jgi:hypothetical protein